MLYLLPHTHFLHHISEPFYTPHSFRHRSPLSVFDWFGIFLFTVTTWAVYAFEVKWGKHLCNVLMLPTSPNKKAGSLDVEYPWPVTQHWPEEVMSGENVPGSARQTDRQTRSPVEIVPPWDFLSCLSYVCPSHWHKLKSTCHLLISPASTGSAFRPLVDPIGHRGGWVLK